MAKAFWALQDGELARLAAGPEAPVAIPPDLLPRVVENLKVLRGHAARVVAAAPDAAPPVEYEA